MRRPCADCPWRKDAPRGVWLGERFAALYRSCQDDGHGIFACHHSADSAPLPCQGWVRAMGDRAIGVRLGVALAYISPDEVDDVGGPELFDTFEDMLRANGIEPPPRNRWVEP